MSLGTLHGMFGVEFGTASGATLLGGITQMTLPTGTDLRSETPSGQLYPQIQTVNAQNIRPSWTTKAIAKALAEVGLTGLDISTLTNGLRLYAQKHADGGTRAGTSSHKRYDIKQGMVIPVTLSCDHQGDATLAQEACVTWDYGTPTDPIVLTESQTLPSPLADDERFGLGPLTIGGVSYTGVRSIEVAFGVRCEMEAADGDIWPTFAAIRTIRPVITWRGIDPQWLKDTGGIPLTGSAVAHASTKQYFRKRAAGGTYVANATAEHVSMTFDGTVVIDPPLDVSGDDPAECTMILTAEYDGSNAPIVISTAAAIS
jgi:hypothetical protein